MCGTVLPLVRLRVHSSYCLGGALEDVSGQPEGKASDMEAAAAEEEEASSDAAIDIAYASPAQRVRGAPSAAARAAAAFALEEPFECSPIEIVPEQDVVVCCVCGESVPNTSILEHVEECLQRQELARDMAYAQQVAEQSSVMEQSSAMQDVEDEDEEPLAAASPQHLNLFGGDCSHVLASQSSAVMSDVDDDEEEAAGVCVKRKQAIQCSAVMIDDEEEAPGVYVKRRQVIEVVEVLDVGGSSSSDDGSDSDNEVVELTLAQRCALRNKA